MHGYLFLIAPHQDSSPDITNHTTTPDDHSTTDTDAATNLPTNRVDDDAASGTRLAGNTGQAESRREGGTRSNTNSSCGGVGVV